MFQLVNCLLVVDEEEVFSAVCNVKAHASRRFDFINLVMAFDVTLPWLDLLD